MTTEKPPAVPQSPQENAETATPECHKPPEQDRRHDQSVWFARALRTTTAHTRIASRRVTRRYVPLAAAAFGQACRARGALTRTACTNIAATATRTAKAARSKLTVAKAKAKKTDPNGDRFAKLNLAEVDLWETNVAEFSLAKNRVVGFMVGLAAGILVAWFAIGLIERPRLVTSPQVATNEGNRAGPNASRVENLSKEIWGKTDDPSTEKNRRKTRTPKPRSDRSSLPGFIDHDLASEAKQIRSREGSGMTEAALVDRTLKQPPAIAREELPPLPSRNASRETSSPETVTIELPEPHPARAPAPPPGTIEARSTDQRDDGTRMGIGLGNLTVQRPPPLQRPAPVSSPQNVAEP